MHTCHLRAAPSSDTRQPTVQDAEVARDERKRLAHQVHIKSRVRIFGQLIATQKRKRRINTVLY
jgi:hypothetical protein